MLIKQRHHIKKFSPLCGEVIEILRSCDYPRLNIAVVKNIEPTQGHYHKTFEEIYFVVNGSIKLRTYDPQTQIFEECVLEALELKIIAPGVHHKVVEASLENCLVAITVPGFDPQDENLSTHLG
jgi:mannose-6-phosphate isomerase-like protein (cupin superfamily)